MFMKTFFWVFESFKKYDKKAKQKIQNFLNLFAPKYDLTKITPNRIKYNLSSLYL